MSWRLLSILLVAHAAATSDSRGMTLQDDRCRATTAYVFIANELPFWFLWEEYFRGCNGNYVIRIASGYHKLRFSYRMIDVMFDLVQSTLEMGTAPNGCKPRWIHFLSDSCVPITSCPVVEEDLAQANASFLLCSKVQSTQWITLLISQAEILLEKRREIYYRWRNEQKKNKVHVNNTLVYGALDEVVWSAEFRKHNLSCTERTITKAVFVPYKGYPPKGSKLLGDHGHPVTWGYDIPILLKQADLFLSEKKYFMRKVLKSTIPYLLPRVRSNLSHYH